MATENREKRNIYRYYQDGNAAVAVGSAAPKQRPERREKQQQAPKKGLSVRRNFIYMVMMLGISAILFVMCAHFMSVRGEARVKEREMIVLQSQLEDLIEENDELEASIVVREDYDEILNTALNEYGMVYPDESEIIKYDAEGEGFIKQYSSIP